MPYLASLVLPWLAKPTVFCENSVGKDAAGLVRKNAQLLLSCKSKVKTSEPQVQQKVASSSKSPFVSKNLGYQG
jgi:hypothetical protein